MGASGGELWQILAKKCHSRGRNWANLRKAVELWHNLLDLCYNFTAWGIFKDK